MRNKCNALLAGLVILFGQQLFSQGTLQGVVSDSTSSQELIGANVFLKGTAMGAITDIEGKYKIKGIPNGTYTLRISYLGFTTKTVEVTISEDQSLVVNASLVPDVLEGNEVVITAQARGQVAAINQQLTSKNIVSVVSEEKIKELPDANAAEAIGRLPGISLVRSGGEATKIVLRGLSSKFSNITVDGVKIPATDVNTRDVDLSTISQGSLAGIELFKTLTSDQDGDAIAGAVNLVTRKAASERRIVLDVKGDYNRLMNSAKQYDLGLSYSERFFDDILGIQMQGNFEHKIRSKENTTYSYTPLYAIDSSNQNTSIYNDYKIRSFTVDFTDEIRSRNGMQGIIDVNTPDSGSIKLSGMYSNTGRNSTIYNRIYPGAGSNTPWDYNFRYSEQTIGTSNASVQGKNYLGDFQITWNASYAESKTDNPYDYALKFTENNGASGGIIASHDHPEINIIPFARNDFSAAACSTAIYSMRENFDKEQTVFTDVLKKYSVIDVISGEIKIGGKYKSKSRWMAQEELDDNSYLHSLATIGIDTNRIINSRFSNYYYNASKFGAPSLSDFVDYPASSRNLLGLYQMTPFINVDAMKLWYDLTKAASVNGEIEYLPNAQATLSNYSVLEKVVAAYLMNTLNFGEDVTFILGTRIEQETNKYTAWFTTGSISNIGIRYGFTEPIRDSTTTYTETIWLPNALLTVRPTEYLTFRFAAYKALARPDFNSRMPNFYVQNSNSSVTVGNPGLKDTKAWNYEVNGQFYNNTIGLVALSAFYKKLDNLVHEMSGVQIDKPYLEPLFDRMGMNWLRTEPFKSLILRNPSSNLNLPYNSNRPSYAWGLEFEQQTNFSFLPGYWSNITLSYNVSITRSETYILGNQTLYRTDSNLVRGKWIVTQTPYHVVSEVKKESEGQPNLYGNAAIGYDIAGFSGRISIFYQDEYVQQYSEDGQSDVIVDPFTKIDLAVKQIVTENVSLFLNINNLTNKEETNSFRNQKKPWQIPRRAELYGTTVDLGVRIIL